MRELRGIAETLDPHVAESLRIVEHFDALVARRVGLVTLVRAATLLTGAAVGISDPERQLTIRIDAAALRDEDAEDPATFPPHWRHIPLGPSSRGQAWLERDGDPHINDLMVLERLAHAVQITIDRTFGWGDEYDEAVALLLNHETTSAARSRLASRLGIGISEALVVVVTPSSEGAPATPLHAVTGDVTFHVIRHERSSRTPTFLQGGASGTHAVDSLPRAAEEALAALRFARPDEFLRFPELGPIYDLITPSTTQESASVARIAELLRETGHDLLRMEALDSRASAREIASRVGVHHSTISKLRDRVNSHVGYDTASPLGSMRFALDLRLYRYFQSPHRRLPM